MGDNFLSKSFLFEIVDSSTEDILESFTLVIPPQSYSIREKQRVSITKTFGNAFIDDYGPDNIEITIKGISGTAHAFPTFQTQGVSSGANVFEKANEATKDVANATKGYRHKEAFYYFRDRIIRYKNNTDFDKKELRVYDLADEQAYKCVLLEFSLDRTADQPLRYPFTISLFVYAQFGSKDISTAKSISISKNPNNAIQNIMDAMDSLGKKVPIFNTVQKIRNTVATMNNQLQLLRAKFNTWLTQGRLLVESPLMLAKQLIETGIILGGFCYDSYLQGKLTLSDYCNMKENLNNQIRESMAMYGFAVEQGTQQTKTATFEKYNGIDFSSDPYNPSPSSIESSFTFSGLNKYTIKGVDTLQGLAKEYLGNEELWPYIALVNKNIDSNNDLIAGEEIYIPIQSDSTLEMKDSFIMSEDTLRNPYGADIKIDTNGNMIVYESNDLATIDGIENVLQAIDTRLKTQIGNLIKQTAYGLLAGIGLAGTSAALSYIRMNFKNSLIQDPRIESVNNVGIQLNNDFISIKADVKLIGIDNSIPVSQVL